MYEAQPPNGSDDTSPRGDGASLVPTFGCDLSREKDHVMIAVRGELDLASSPEFLRLVRHEVNGQGPAPRALVLDLRRLDFLDSSGIGALCQIREIAHERGVELRLTDVPEHARRVLEITGLTDLFGLD
jgi:anti-sigma B factor antagonist